MQVEEDSLLVFSSSLDGFPGGTWPSHSHSLSFHFFLTGTKQEGTSVRVYCEAPLKSRSFYALIVENAFTVSFCAAHLFTSLLFFLLHFVCVKDVDRVLLNVVLSTIMIFLVLIRNRAVL